MALSISNTLRKPFGIDGLLPTPNFGMKTTTPAFGQQPAAPAAAPAVAPVTAAPKVAPVAQQQNPAQSQYYQAPAQTGSALGGAPAAPFSSAATPPQPPASRGLFTDVVSSLAKKASGASDFSKKAQTEYSDAVEAQKKLKGDIAERYAKIEGAYGGHGIPLEFVQGREAQLRNLAASLESAASTEVAGKAAALGAGVSQQSAEQSGLASAAGYAQPQLGQPGQSYYNPLEGGSGGGADQIVSGWAQYLAQGGDPSQVPNTVSGNSVLWQQVLNQAKQANPGFDVNTALGAAGARQTTAGMTAPLAGAQANTQIINQGKQEVATMEASLNTADQNVQNLATIMQQSGINNFNAVPLNNIANLVRANLSDGAVLSYQTLMAGTRALLTSVYISRGLAPTDASSTADATLAKATTLQALIDQYNTAKSEAANLIQNKKFQISQAEQGLNQGAPTAPAGTPPAGTTPSGAKGWF